LNGHSEEGFLKELSRGFEIEKMGPDIFKPSKLHEFSLYLDGNWYKLTARQGTYNDDDPIGVLDVTILSNQVLGPVLDIYDLRTSKRIDFVGGIRGLEALKKRRRIQIIPEMKNTIILWPSIFRMTSCKLSITTG